MLSIGAAIENMLLYATSRGLGTLWIRDIIYFKEPICKLLNIPSKYELVSAISIGYPAETPSKRVISILDSMMDYLIGVDRVVMV